MLHLMSQCDISKNSCFDAFVRSVALHYCVLIGVWPAGFRFNTLAASISPKIVTIDSTKHSYCYKEILIFCDDSNPFPPIVSYDAVETNNILKLRGYQLEISAVNFTISKDRRCSNARYL